MMFVIASSLTACRQQAEISHTDRDTLSLETLSLTDEQIKAINITVGNVTQRHLPTNLNVNGMLDVPPQNLVTISAPMGGFIKSTKLLQGMKIQKGEVIAALEHQDYIQLQQDYLDNNSRLEFLETEYKRQVELSRENINSQKALQKAKSDYESSKAQVEGLSAKLRMINIDPKSIGRNGISGEIKIYSPLSGFVTEVNVNPGEFVTSAHPMFRIVDVTHLHAEVQVYEKDIHLVRIGQRLEFHLPGEMNPRKASVFLVGKEISPERTVRVHCHLDKEDEALLPGMFIEATIELSSVESKAVPSRAIVNADGKQAVFVKKDNNTFELVELKTGVDVDGFTQVDPQAELNPTDSVVVDGSFELLGLLMTRGNYQ